MKTKLLAAALAAVLTGAFGCRGTHDHVRAEVPEGAKFIGGGWSVTFTAPCAGQLYAFDPDRERVTGSFSVEEKTTYVITSGVLSFQKGGEAEHWTRAPAAPLGFSNCKYYFLPMTELFEQPAKQGQ